MSGLSQSFRFAAKQIEHDAEHEDRAHGGQAQHTQDGYRVLADAGRVAAAIQQNQVAGCADMVVARLDQRRAARRAADNRCRRGISTFGHRAWQS